MIILPRYGPEVSRGGRWPASSVFVRGGGESAELVLKDRAVSDGTERASSQILQGSLLQRYG